MNSLQIMGVANFAKGGTKKEIKGKRMLMKIILRPPNKRQPQNVYTCYKSFIFYGSKLE